VDPYEVLGIPATSSNDELEARYRFLLRRYHPDLHHDDGPAGVAQAEYATRLLNQAMTQIRRERAGARPASATTDHGPGDAGDERRASTGTGPDRRAHARPREPRSTTGGSHAPGGPGAHAQADAPWWTGPQKQGSPCPFCCEHFADLASYDEHLRDVHRFRIGSADRRRRFPITISRGAADALLVIGLLLASVALLWLSTRIQISVVLWFVIWLVIVGAFLPALLLRPRHRKR
jgi:hypothetical protein